MFESLFGLLEGTGGWCVDGVTAGFDVAGQGDDVMAFPAGGFINGVIGAEELAAAGYHGIADGGVIGACFLCVAVGTGADEIAFADEVGDVGGGAVVTLDEGCVGTAGIGVSEDDAAVQRWVPFEVDRGHSVLVHEEDDFAAGIGEGRPVTG